MQQTLFGPMILQQPSDRNSMNIILCCSKEHLLACTCAKKTMQCTQFLQEHKISISIFALKTD